MGMLLLGCLLAVLVGMTLGVIGSGGSILTVPILVYILGVDPVLATTYSLIAVGVTAFVGAGRGILKKEVDFQKLLGFGLPSLIIVFLTRQFLLPLVPDEIHIGPFVLEQRVALMILFALLMLASSISMIRSGKEIHDPIPVNRQVPLSIIIVQGMAVGFITGLVGAGGGFLIIPALVNFYYLPMRKAVATSLVIIAVNSCFGLLGDLEKFPEMDWNLISLYCTGTILGILLGFYVADRISNRMLKQVFGYMVLGIGLLILFREILFTA